MSARSDLYGFQPDDQQSDGLSQARHLLEKLLDRQFVAHDSAYFGPYYRAPAPPEVISIKSNLPDAEGEVLYPDFAQWPVVIEIEGSDRWASLDGLVAHQDLVRLRSIES